MCNPDIGNGISGGALAGIAAMAGPGGMLAGPGVNVAGAGLLSETALGF